MNKKQVGAFLKVMGKDEFRPTIRVAYVDKYENDYVLVATDGYKLAAVKMDEDVEPLVGKMIRREAIEKWYKLATGKSRLTGEELVAVSSDDYAQNNSYQEGTYPDWKKLIPSYEPEEGQTMMAFNAEFFKIVQDLDGENAIKVKLYGDLAPMVMKTERGVYIVMPMKG